MNDPNDSSATAFWIQFTSASPCKNDSLNLTNNFPGKPGSPATCQVTPGLAQGTLFAYKFLTDDPNNPPPPPKTGGAIKKFALPESCNGCNYVYDNGN
jgi:hypothetical protein